MQFINRALPDTDAWIRHFEDASVPVLARTIGRLQELRDNIDDLAPRDVSEVIEEDPLMALKTLIWAGKHLARNVSSSRASLANEIETVDAAIVNAGIAPFFRQFAELDSVDERLAGLPQARLGLQRVVARSLAAGEFARDWAGYRNDLDIQVIGEAAMLHDVAEMLVWVFAPGLALQMQAYQRSHPHHRSRETQRLVLGISVNELEVAVMKAWRLPTLLRRLTDDAHADSPQVRNVILAANLARHLANAHDDPALPDDISDIARLLRTSQDWVEARVLSTPLVRTPIAAS